MSNCEKNKNLCNIVSNLSGLDERFFERIIEQYGKEIPVDEKAFVLIEQWQKQGFLIPREKGELFNLLAQSQGNPKPHSSKLYGARRCESYTERQVRGRRHK